MIQGNITDKPAWKGPMTFTVEERLGSYPVLFVGGPLDNRVLHGDMVPDVFEVKTENQSFKYYIDHPLNTGVSVLSCLWGGSRLWAEKAERQYRVVRIAANRKNIPVATCVREGSETLHVDARHLGDVRVNDVWYLSPDLSECRLVSREEP